MPTLPPSPSIASRLLSRRLVKTDRNESLSATTGGTLPCSSSVVSMPLSAACPLITRRASSSFDAKIERSQLQRRRSRVLEKVGDVAIDSLHFCLELIRQTLESFALRLILRRERRAQVIQSEIDVVERVADFVGDCRCQPSDHRGFFNLMKLRSPIRASARVCAIMSLKAAASAPISSRRLVGTRTSKSPVATRRAATDKSLIGRVKPPNKQSRDQRGRQQQQERV